MRLLDDDMDELFRNAASQYPLKTDGANWDALSSRLQTATPQGPAAARWRDNKWCWLGILILLTALFFIIYTPPLETGKLPLTGDKLPASKVKFQLTNNNNSSTPVIDVVTDQTTHPGTTADQNNENIPTTTNNNYTTAQQDAVTTTTIIHTMPSSPDNSIINTDTTTTDTTTTPPAIAAATQDSILQQSDTTLPTLAKKKSPAKVQKGLYFGIIASPDFSTVKMQRVQKVGYSAGIILGYRISRSFAVETGLLYDRKNYYSKGSSFSKSKIPYIQNWKILNVDGYCNMWEIPVNVRYFIKNGQHTSWYANAGLSSYLMKKEDYAFNYLDDYGTLKNNSWDYKNATRNWFSIIHVGVGLEHNLGAIGKLRVEPYLKIPASGLGIGDLPITSMGVNVGITKSIR
jgi:hypothetical protein